MSRNGSQSIYLSNGDFTSVKVVITATASGFEVDSELRLGGKMPHLRHVDVFRTRELAVAAAKSEAARVAAALFGGQTP